MPWADNVTLAVEFGFGSGPLAASPTWTDVTAYVRQINITRGRLSPLEAFDAGTATVLLDNQDGRFQPGNSSSPYSPSQRLGTPLRITATYSLTDYVIFYGAVTDWPLTYDQQPDATVLLTGTDNLARLRLCRVENDYAAEDADTRIGNVLDDCSWPAGARALDAPVSDTLAARDEYAGSAIALIDEAVHAEQGFAFVAADGDFTFKKRTVHSGASPTTVFNNSTDLPFQRVRPNFTDRDLINRATVTPADDDDQTDSDSTSITNHGEVAVARTNDSIAAGPDALNVAEWIVGRFKDVDPRIERIAVVPEADPANLWPVVLSLDLVDTCTVQYDPPGAGDTYDQDSAIEQIVHSIQPGQWVVQYATRPLVGFETSAYWVLGTSTLGTSTVLA